MSKKKVANREEGAQSIANFYRLRSNDQEEENQQNKDNEENVIPSQTKESLNIPKLIDTSETPSLAKLPEVQPSVAPTGGESNEVIVTMMTQMRQGLIESVDTMGEKLEAKLAKSIQETAREIRESVDKVQTNLQAIESKLDNSLDMFNEKMNVVNENFIKLDNRMEEAETRIVEVEDGVEKLQALPPEVEVIFGHIDKIYSVLQIDACANRRNNIIINGIPGKKATIKEAETTFRNLCRNEMKLGEVWANTVVLNEVYRFPAKDKKSESWPLFVSLSSLSRKDEFFKATPNLKGTGIFVRNDLAPHLLEEKSELHKKANKLKVAPYNFRTKVRDTYNKVWLEYLREGDTKWKVWNPREKIIGE